MRRYILLSLLLCLKWTAWGQATYDYRYWFDSDDENQTTGTVATDNWHIDADLTGLTHTYHSIHFQVKDTAGVWSVPVTRHFVKLPDPKMKRGFFWFNDDVRKKTEIPVSAGEFQMDVSELENQLHHVHYIFLDDEENATSPLTAYFLKSADNRAEATYHYWTDNNSDNVKSGKCCNGVMMLDMSGEKDGFHVLHLLGGMDGDFSQPTTRMFIKVPQTEGVGSLSCLCYVDGELFKQESVPTSGGVVDWTLDVSLLSNGFHSIQVQVVTPSGAATSVHESFFFRTTMSGELGNMKLVYNVDGGEYKYQAGDFGTGVFHFDIDVSALKDGLHRLNYMLMSETGTSTKMSSSFFVKTPLGGPGVANYKYWINENEDDAVKVTLDERQELFKLIALLPVAPQPIRSKCFHFEIEEDGTPMMYAKNDFHIQFIDVKNYFLDATRQYIDYNAGQQIDDITQLESGKRVYKVKPAENEVLWFKVDALRGDSLSFKTDLAASIDVFNAEGDTLYHAEGTNAEAYGGFHADETTTYYVALHDATAKNGTNIALDYVKIDKFAVLEYSPNQIGLLGEGYVEVELYGNGFELLKKAYLQSASNTLIPDSIAILSRADMKMLYELYGNEAIGNYDIVLEFEEDGITETLTIENAISIEEGQWVEPEVTVTSIKSVARPYPVKITITNPCNIGMSYVPLNIAFDKADLFDEVKFIDFYISMPDTTKFGKYLPFYITDNFLGKNIRAAVINLFLPQLNAGETKEITLGFVGPSQARFNLYAWAGDALNHPNPTLDTLSNIPSMWYYLEPYMNEEEDTIQNSPMRTKGMARASRLRRSVNMARNVANNAVGTGMAIGGIVNGLRGTGYRASLEAAGIDPSDPLYADIMGMVPPLPSPGDIRAGVNGFARYMCNNTPNPLPEPVEILNPGDPNDIIGYEAPSGSKHMRNDIEDVQFIIRCENDPEIATAAAHKIVITDTIDGYFYDLTTFAPTEINIGGRVMELDGTEKNFIKTMDLRPSINAIAQIELKYSSSTGIAEWTMTSLDPMTMEFTDHVMDGVLPVNVDGNGEGSVSFRIRQKTGFDDGTEISNRASIVFDFEEAIQTPVWTNIIDTTSPVSRVTNAKVLNDTIAEVMIEAYDNLSGPWQYDVYAKADTWESWKKVAKEVPVDSIVQVSIEEKKNYSYCVILTDSASNVEQKELIAEYSLTTYMKGDANSDGTIDAADVVLTISKYLGNDVLINTMAADVNRDGVIDAQDIVGIQQIFLESETLSRANVHKQRIRLWQKQ